MIEADRLISAEPLNEEEVLDRAIRPKLLTEYVGQPHVREQMEIFIQAAKQRGDALDHLLIFGPPGLGKTTLALALSGALGLSFGRIQSTSDLLPSDITGLSIFNREDNRFKFIPGPIFNNIVLVDEVNRAMPKTQSAMLEAMEERRVTVEGVPYPLPEPFLVIATQNPVEQVGTYPLP